MVDVIMIVGVTMYDIELFIGACTHQGLTFDSIKLCIEEVLLGG